MDSWLALLGRKGSERYVSGVKTQLVNTPVGAVRTYDSKTNGPCVVMVPDGPNVIEHHLRLGSAIARKKAGRFCACWPLGLHPEANPA